jgi:hypothetical protein
VIVSDSTIFGSAQRDEQPVLVKLSGEFDIRYRRIHQGEDGLILPQERSSSRAVGRCRGGAAHPGTAMKLLTPENNTRTRAKIVKEEDEKT